MKSHFMSGVSARVKRWVGLMNVVVIASLLVLISAMPASARTPSINPMAVCFPSNNNLQGPVGPAVTSLAGAVGGLIPLIVMVVLVLLVLYGIVAVARKRDLAPIIQTIAGVVAVPFIAVLAMIIFTALWSAFNNGC